MNCDRDPWATDVGFLALWAIAVGPWALAPAVALQMSSGRRAGLEEDEVDEVGVPGEGGNPALQAGVVRLLRAAVG